jgi:hypothetical protein
MQIIQILVTEVKRQRLRAGFWLLAVVTGSIHFWAYRRNITDVDGISYLDMGDAYMRGDWGTAVNGLWSPLYAWLLGVAVYLVQPSPEREYQIFQLVNLVIYIFALFSFDFFIRQLLQYGRSRADKFSENESVRMPDWALLSLGYTLFIWSSFYWMWAWLQCPDMCVAAFVYLAAGILLRIRAGATSWLTFVAFGTVLGLAYLAKAAMFPLGFVFLAVAAFSTSDLRKAAPRVLSACAVFLLFAAPLIIALSIKTGRITFSNAGRINYIWHVNGNALSWNHFPHWQPGIGDGTPEHAATKRFQAPDVYVFEPPGGGTYPMWYDPTYWWEGVSPRFSLSEQVKALKVSRSFYYNFFFDRPQCVLIVGLVILCLMSSGAGSCLKNLASQWVLLIPPIAAMVMYAFIHVESRYIGAFAVVMWLGLFSGLRIPAQQQSRRLLGATAMALTGVILTVTVFSTLAELREKEVDPITDAASQWKKVESLQQMGLSSGDSIGVIGDTLGAPRWARMARVKIVAEMPGTGAQDFWFADDVTKSQIIETFANAGVKAIVADTVPRGVSTTGWQKLGSRSDYVYIFK